MSSSCGGMPPRSRPSPPGEWGPEHPWPCRAACSRAGESGGGPQRGDRSASRAAAAVVAALSAHRLRLAFLPGEALDRFDRAAPLAVPSRCRGPLGIGTWHRYNAAITSEPGLLPRSTRATSALRVAAHLQRISPYTGALPLAVLATMGTEVGLRQRRRNALCDGLSRSRRACRGAMLTAETEAVLQQFAGSQTEDTLMAFDRHRVQRLKDLVFIKEMRAAITSGEFALRLRGAEQPGLVDYEELCNRLNIFIDRLDRQPPQPQVLAKDEAWKAHEELKMTHNRLEERLLEMTRARRQHVAGSEPAAKAGAAEAAEPKAPAPAKKSASANPEPSRILLYLRDDHTVDIDSALKESCSMAPFSSDLWDRLRGREALPKDDWTNAVAGEPTPKAHIVERQSALARAKHELLRAQAMRAKVLNAMSKGEWTAGLDSKVEETKQLFRWDRVITGRRILLLLSNMDLLFELVAEELETRLRQANIQEWDGASQKLKTLVFEFSLLDKQIAPYQRFVKMDPEVVREGGLDFDELRMLEAHIARIADQLGIQADCIGQENSFLRPFRHQRASMRKSLDKIKRGVMFYANGMSLLYEDLQHAVKLILKVTFLSYTLKPREVQACYRAAKDLFVLIPFLIILLIPMTPPGHVLVFSLIMKVYPDFFPSPFTDRRQNVMRVYNEIKPHSARRKSWP